MGNNIFILLIMEDLYKRLTGIWCGQYNDLEGVWQDGDVKLELMQDKTYKCARQCNNGRDDPGWTTDYKGEWEIKGNEVIITPRPNDFKSDFQITDETLTFRIEHIGYETPQTDLVLRKR